jgi:hypothetical protein
MILYACTAQRLDDRHAKPRADIQQWVATTGIGARQLVLTSNCHLSHLSDRYVWRMRTVEN